jgi:hypothetical protein
MRREERIKSKLPLESGIEDLEPGMKKYSRSVRIGQNFLDEPIAAIPVGVGQTVEKTILLGVFQLVNEIPLLFVAKGRSIADQELEIPGVWRVDRGVVDLVQDPVTEGKPDAAARMVGGPEAVLAA